MDIVRRPLQLDIDGKVIVCVNLVIDEPLLRNAYAVLAGDVSIDHLCLNCRLSILDNFDIFLQSRCFCHQLHGTDIQIALSCFISFCRDFKSRNIAVGVFDGRNFLNSICADGKIAERNGILSCHSVDDHRCIVFTRLILRRQSLTGRQNIIVVICFCNKSVIPGCIPGLAVSLTIDDHIELAFVMMDIVIGDFSIVQQDRLPDIQLPLLEGIGECDFPDFGLRIVLHFR